MNKTISTHLRECAFIVCSDYTKAPKIPKGEKVEDHLLNYEQAQDKISNSHVPTIATRLGYNGVVALDADCEEAFKIINECMPESYTEQTISLGSYRTLYRLEGSVSNETLNLNGKHALEIKTEGTQVLVAPSVAKNKEGKIMPYTILKDIPLATISESHLLTLKQHFDTKGTSTKASSEAFSLLDQDVKLRKLFEGDKLEYPSRSEAELALVNGLVTLNANKDEIFAIMSRCKLGKWNSENLGYRELTYKNAVAHITQANLEKLEPLGFLSWNDLKKIRKPRVYIVQDRVIAGQTSILFGKQATFKSIIALDLALSIASGKKWLGKYRVKKCGVGILSAENAEFMDKERIQAIMKAKGIRKLNNFYFLPRAKCGDILDNEFSSRIFHEVEKLNIKCLFIDTADAVTPTIVSDAPKEVERAFKKFFHVLNDKGVYVEFIAHTPKNKPTSALGSMKWEGKPDNVYYVKRNDKNRKLISIYNTKGRYGEISTKHLELNIRENKGKYESIEPILIKEEDYRQSEDKTKSKKESAKEFLIKKT